MKIGCCGTYDRCDTVVDDALSAEVEGRAGCVEERRSWRAALPAALVIFDADMLSTVIVLCC